MSYQPPPPPPSGYGYGPPGGYMPPQDHPKAQTAMILGILGIAVCQVVAIPAYVVGKNALQEIDASGGRLGGRSMANAGRIMGIIGIALLVFGCVAFVGVILLQFLIVGSTM